MIVHFSGPHRCGSKNDVQIFRESLMKKLRPGERVIADAGYVGESRNHVRCPGGIANHMFNEAAQSDVRHRHETVNSRFKEFNVLKQSFCGDIYTHGVYFAAVAVILQLNSLEGKKIWYTCYNV